MAGLRNRAQQPAATDWAATAARVIGELENLNRSTERDFLVVGEKLMEFCSTARQIAADMQAVTELIAGEGARNVTLALTHMLEHSRQMDRRIEQSGGALGEVRELSRAIRQCFSGLRNTVAVFQTLCTLTRIETARLGGAGADLDHLTSEVGPLSESIQTSGQMVLDASDQLDRDVQSALSSGAGLRGAQLKELPAMISGAQASLLSLDERRQGAAESSLRQSSEYAEVSSAINDLVSSIQFHDITRQQVEHVIQALAHLRSQAGKKDGGWRTNPAPAAANTRVALTLQSRHLADAAHLFGQSAEHIERDMERIAGQVATTPQASREMLGISSPEEDSFFLKMEEQLSAILHMLGLCAAAELGLASTGAGLEETLGRMRASVAEIRATEIRIQRISTNATIRATHIGDAGIALNKIAEVMQRLALESSANSEQAAATLDTMSDAARRVGGESHTAAGAGPLTSLVIEEMRSAVAQLQAANETSGAKVQGIVALSARLAGELDALRSNFTAGRLFASVVERARGELERVGASAADGSSQDAGIGSAQQLEHLASTYTMQRQRDVHASLVGGRAVAPLSLQSANGSGSVKLGVHVESEEDGELGDNVELF